MPQGHRTAEELGAEVQAIAPDVHMSTIYRNLDDLERLGVVVHAHLGHGPATYHLAAGAHGHFVCEAVRRHDRGARRDLRQLVARRGHGSTSPSIHTISPCWGVASTADNAHRRRRQRAGQRRSTSMREQGDGEQGAVEHEVCGDDPVQPAVLLERSGDEIPEGDGEKKPDAVVHVIAGAHRQTEG